MRKTYSAEAVRITCEYCEERARHFAKRYARMREIRRLLVSGGHGDAGALAAYSLEAWRARQAMNEARADYREAVNHAKG